MMKVIVILILMSVHQNYANIEAEAEVSDLQDDSEMNELSSRQPAPQYCCSCWKQS